jgi:polar amino acid transport system substrate-binding protein
VVLLVGALLLAGCAVEEDAWERIATSGVLRVGVDPTFPPFALAEGDQIEGLDVDLARALAEELGLEAQFTYFGYDGLYDALATGQVDVLISALVIAPERMKDVTYSAAYFDAGQFLFVGEKSPSVDSMADLEGKTVAVELGALGHVLAQEWQGRLRDLAVQTYAGAAEALSAVANGEADAALVDSVSGRLFLRDHPTEAPRLRMIAEAVAPEPYAIAIRIEDEMLQRELNAVLQRLLESGRMELSINRWLDS